MKLPRLLVALAVVAWAPLAHADDRAVATELFNAGRDLMKQGDYASACPKLAESVRLDATVGALAKLASCEEHLSHLVAARAAWEQALNLAHTTGDSRETEVRAELARVDHVVPKLALTASGALPSGVVLRVDDLQLGAGTLGVSVPVEPGKHEVSVTAPNRKPWSVSVEVLADGATTPVTIPALEDAQAAAVVPVPSAAPASASTAETPSPAAGRGLPPLRVAALVTGATGVVGVAVGSVLGVTAIARKSDAGCEGTVCPDTAHANKLSNAKTLADGSTAAFVAGGALLAGAAAMWLLAPSARVQVGRVEVQPSVGGVVIGGRWE